MKWVIEPEDPIEVLQSAGRGDCVEFRGYVTDYYVRAFPTKRYWDLELVRNKYFRHGRDAAVAQRRRAELIRLGWDFACPGLCPDAVAGQRLASPDVEPVNNLANETLDRFNDELQEAEIESASRRRAGWPDFPFALARWDWRESPRFDVIAEGVRRLEGRRRPRPFLYWRFFPPPPALDEIAGLISTYDFDAEEADDLWRDIVDEFREGLGDDVFYRC